MVWDTRLAVLEHYLIDEITWKVMHDQNDYEYVDQPEPKQLGALPSKDRPMVVCPAFEDRDLRDELVAFLIKQKTGPWAGNQPKRAAAYLRVVLEREARKFAKDQWVALLTREPRRTKSRDTRRMEIEWTQQMERGLIERPDGAPVQPLSSDHLANVVHLQGKDPYEVHAAFASLSADQQQAVVWKLTERDDNAISERYGIPLSTLKDRINAAWRELDRRVGPILKPPEEREGTMRLASEQGQQSAGIRKPFDQTAAEVWGFDWYPGAGDDVRDREKQRQEEAQAA